MHYLKVSIICFIIAILSAYCISCSHKQVVDGEPTAPPIGYTIHCIENPNSIFCREVKH